MENNMLPFDTAQHLSLRELNTRSQPDYLTSRTPNAQGFYFILPLIPAGNKLTQPFKICEYFGVPAPISEGENIWEKVEDIRMQVFAELRNLIPSGEYRLDWSEDGAFGVFFKPTDEIS
jgi:hypothetical protein